MKCKIEGDEIVVRVKISDLPNAWTQHVHGTSDPEDFRMPKISDAEAFAPYFVEQLNHEDETGTTPLMRVFDEAIEDAVFVGAEGLAP